jgi:hypothetical protein
LPEFVFIALASIVLTLLVELPFCNIINILFDKKPIKSKSEQLDGNNNVPDCINKKDD